MLAWLMRALGFRDVIVVKGLDTEAAGFGPREKLVEDGRMVELIQAILEGSLDISAHCESVTTEWR